VPQGGKIVTVQLDVTDAAQVAALWSKVPQELRDVDILGK
jgi:3-hydroxy acid dehydrogenase/malonic semialdehyde reductase